MTIPHRAMTVGLILATVLAFGGMPSHARAATMVTYSLAGTATTNGSFGCIDCLFVMEASGTATCAACDPTDPISGAFDVSITTITSYPPSPCKVKSLGGELSVTWADGTTSSASVDGHFIDGKPILVLDGQYPPGPIFGGDTFALVLNNFPPSPCLAATNPVSGTLTMNTG
jgi:hypothetical protein